MSRPAQGTKPTGSTDSGRPSAMTCRELVALVTDYLEGALPEHERVRFDAHLDQCDGCSRHLEQVRITIASLGRIREEDLQPALRDRLLAAFRDWKR